MGDNPKAGCTGECALPVGKTLELILFHMADKFSPFPFFISMDNCFYIIIYEMAGILMRYSNISLIRNNVCSHVNTTISYDGNLFINAQLSTQIATDKQT